VDILEVIIMGKYILGMLAESGAIYSDIETAIAEMAKSPEGQAKLEICLELAQKLAADLLKAITTV